MEDKSILAESEYSDLFNNIDQIEWENSQSFILCPKYASLKSLRWPSDLKNGQKVAKKSQICPLRDVKPFVVDHQISSA